MRSSTTESKDTLYYDGSCPLCTAEICKLDAYTQGKLTLVDIHKMDTPDITQNATGTGTKEQRHQTTSETLPSKEALLSRLHLRTAEGDWLVGIDANIRAWHHTPYSGLWKILGWPVIRIFSAAAYELWLKWRSRKSTNEAKKA